MRKICGLLEVRYGSEEQEAYLRWMHEPRPDLGDECPHELIATGRPEPVLDLLLGEP